MPPSPISVSDTHWPFTPNDTQGPMAPDTFNSRDVWGIKKIILFSQQSHKQENKPDQLTACLSIYDTQLSSSSFQTIALRWLYWLTGNKAPTTNWLISKLLNKVNICYTSKQKVHYSIVRCGWPKKPELLRKRRRGNDHMLHHLHMILHYLTILDTVIVQFHTGEHNLTDKCL